MLAIRPLSCARRKSVLLGTLLVGPACEATYSGAGRESSAGAFYKATALTMVLGFDRAVIRANPWPE